MSFYERHAAQRDQFEILAFHDAAAASLEDLDEKLKPIISGPWKGKPLPFPILLDATDQTHRTNFGIQSYPTVILIDPEGKLVRQSGEHDLESILTAAQLSGVPYAEPAERRT
jgi:hypothetical protein